MRLQLNISKSYGDVRALEDIDLALDAGVTAVMGHNGCGKSTLLRIAALLEPPTSGEVAYYDNGKPLQTNLALRRRVTLSLPSRAGIFSRSVIDNAAYGLRVRGIDRVEAHKQAIIALEMVGMKDLYKAQARTLSSGQARRLALARALACQPDVLFMDEPTASVDEDNTEQIEQLILDMKAGLVDGAPATIVIATHDKAQAQRLADRVVTMSRGKLVSAAVKYLNI